MPRLALALLLFLSPGFSARLNAKSSAMSSYLSIREDEDEFSGEGLALLKDFEDLSKAAKAARSRALEALGESIRVHVSSKTTEKTELKDGKAREEIKSEGESKVELSLENVKYLELPDFPDAGKLTVLAHLGKAEYRRQMAGKKVAVFGAERGLRLHGELFRMGWLSTLYDKASPASTSSTAGFGPGADPQNVTAWGGEFLYRGWVLGFDWLHSSVDGIFRTSGPNLAKSTIDVSMIGFQFGYDWAPWAGRVQAYAPLRLEGSTLGVGYGTSVIAGLGAGLGLRYWPNDSLAIDLSFRQSLGFNSVNLADIIPPTLPGGEIPASLTGQRFQLGLIWSGF